jgi:hypothetical protein
MNKKQAMAKAVHLRLDHPGKRFDVVQLIGTDEYFAVPEKSKDNDERYVLVATPSCCLSK